MTTLRPGQPVHVTIGNERHRATVQAIASGKVLLAFRPAVYNARLNVRVSWWWCQHDGLQISEGPKA